MRSPVQSWVPLQESTAETLCFFSFLYPQGMPDNAFLGTILPTIYWKSSVVAKWNYLTHQDICLDTPFPGDPESGRGSLQQKHNDLSSDDTKEYRDRIYCGVCDSRLVAFCCGICVVQCNRVGHTSA